MTQTLVATDTQSLFWNERGRIACAAHAPYKGSDTWKWERWSKVTENDRSAWLAEVGHDIECESKGAYCAGVKHA